MKIFTWAALVLLLSAGSLVAGRGSEDVTIMTLVPGQSPEDSTLSVLSLTGKRGELFTFMALADTVRFKIYGPSWPGYQTILLPPGVTYSSASGSLLPRIDSVTVDRKTTSAYAMAVVYHD